jgi:hypothetical protein
VIRAYRRCSSYQSSLAARICLICSWMLAIFRWVWAGGLFGILISRCPFAGGKATFFGLRVGLRLVLECG